MTVIKNDLNEHPSSTAKPNHSSTNTHHTPVVQNASTPAIITPLEPVVGTRTPLSIWSDPAVVVGVAMFVGKLCRTTSLAFPAGLLALLHQHAESHDFACKLTIVWLKKHAVIADLLPPHGREEQSDA